MNALEHETSPYLRQHAANPVDWLPWGAAAFDRARREDRPILLSVGYSACHWCHVMAHESFEDARTAEVMNRLFVNVKVDREERPDVDAVYMQAVQALTGRGGWPMTVFLDPEGRPFYAGTYFPNDSFLHLLEAVETAWQERRSDLDSDAERMTELIRQSNAPAPSDTALGRDLLDRAVFVADRQFDPEWGGFGRAPKFPQAMTLSFLVRSWARTGSTRTLDIVQTCLDAMAGGGIYDHVGGGFHRYSVDAFWLVPHFEKMLYDQAVVARAYVDAYLATGEPRYRDVIEETIEYVLRDLALPGGGFASAEDADSEGEEGRFYVWRMDETRSVCGADAPAVIDHYGVTAGGNFEGSNILHSPRRAARRSPEVERGRQALFEARRARVRPALDDKVLLAWNALFSDTLARAGAALDRPEWVAHAAANAQFLLDAMRDQRGRLLRSWQGGRARHLAYAEDYAALLGVLATLAELDSVAWIAEARWVANDLIRLFADPVAGGFFTTGHDAEALIARPKDLFDNATPSPGSLAADGLLRLAALTGDRDLEAPALGAIRLVSDAIAENPTAFAQMLCAVDRSLATGLEIAVVGPPSDPATHALWREVAGRYLPNATVVRAAEGEGGELTPLLAERPMLGGAPTAYVCEGFVCKQPVTDPAGLRSQIDERPT